MAGMFPSVSRWKGTICYITAIKCSFFFSELQLWGVLPLYVALLGLEHKDICTSSTIEVGLYTRIGQKNNLRRLICTLWERKRTPLPWDQ